MTNWRPPTNFLKEETVKQLHPLPERACGTCTLCCTIMRVEEDDGTLVTDWQEPCKHLCKGGCGIYETRPTSCKVFECVWLASQRFPDVALSKSDRPDRSGIVMDVNSKDVTIVHCQTPEAYKRPRNWALIMKLIRKGNKVTLEHGDGKVSVVETDGSITLMEYIGTDPDTNENMYRRIR